MRRVVALVVDFGTTHDAEILTRQVAEGGAGEATLVTVHVDNGNERPVVLSEAQLASGVRLLRLERNGGYAAGLHRALEALRAAGEEFDACWFLNSDLEVEPDALRRLLEVLERRPRVGAAGPRVMRGRTGRVWGARGRISPLRGTTGMSDWPRSGVLPRWSYVPGSSLLVRSEAYWEVGGIPERYGMYYEEAHLCVQLQKRGWELWVETEAVVYHSVDSMKGGIPSRSHAFYFTRNNLYFWRENFHIPPALQFPRMLWTVLRDVLVPLRRARSRAEAADRLRFVWMGLRESFLFLRSPVTPFEAEQFGLAGDGEGR